MVARFGVPEMTFVRFRDNWGLGGFVLGFQRFLALLTQTLGNYAYLGRYGVREMGIVRFRCDWDLVGLVLFFSRFLALLPLILSNFAYP